MARRASEPDGDKWEGERVDRWIRQSEGLERQLEPVSDVLFATAGLRPGERVLDVGCGTGPTTRRAAVAVGPDGAVTGLDVAAPMLERASTVDVARGSAPITWVEADATTWRPDQPGFDVVLSRFGVMFFDDPPAAFASLARATAPGGRLHMAVWARRSESHLFEVPLSVAMATLAAAGAPPPDTPPDDGGPFSLSAQTTVSSLLGRRLARRAVGSTPGPPALRRRPGARRRGPGITRLRAHAIGHRRPRRHPPRPGRQRHRPGL